MPLLETLSLHRANPGVVKETGRAVPIEKIHNG